MENPIFIDNQNAPQIAHDVIMTMVMTITMH